jgi:hypothetical protein
MYEDFVNTSSVPNSVHVASGKYCIKKLYKELWNKYGVYSK